MSIGMPPRPPPPQTLCTSTIPEAESPIVRQGYLKRYKRRCLGRDSWVKNWVVLHADSTLQWFSKQRRQSGCRPVGSVCLRNHPELIAVAHFAASRVPDFPRLRRLDQALNVLAVGTLLPRCRPTPERLHKVIWLMARTPWDCRNWMRSVARTLPPRAGQMQMPVLPGPSLPSRFFHPSLLYSAEEFMGYGSGQGWFDHDNYPQLARPQPQLHALEQPPARDDPNNFVAAVLAGIVAMNLRSLIQSETSKCSNESCRNQPLFCGLRTAGDEVGKEE